MARPRKNPDVFRDPPVYARRIRELREEHEATQQNVADVLKVKQRTYADYELGNIRVPVDALVVLARYYDTDLNYICGMTDTRSRAPRYEKPAE